MAKILIIEDNDILNQAYTFMLKSKDHTVESAYDGEEGLLKVKDFKPDIILLDYLMPKMDGKEFLKRYKKLNIRTGTKILLLTNLSAEEKINDAMALGVYRNLLKSELKPSDLVSIIDEIIGDESIDEKLLKN
jgi:CheY-like chemotaxis protein